MANGRDGSGNRTPVLPVGSPGASTEAAVAAVWADVLGLDVVDRHDDFFALGGHSLLAIQLMVRVRDRLAVDLPLRALFESPTVAGLAAAVDAAAGRRPTQVACE